MDSISSVGTFVTYKGTDKIVYVVDKHGRNEKSSTHVSYDEAHMSADIRVQPPMAQALQQAGYRKEPFSDSNPTPVEHDSLRVRLLSEKGTKPTKGSTNTAGFDLYSAENTVIKPGERQLIHTDIALEIPTGQYGQIFSRSGLASKHNIDTKAGVIDSDYRGKIKILLENNGTKPYTVQEGHRIAQLVLLYIPSTPKVEVTEHLTTSQRGEQGFGSTCLQQPTKHSIIIKENQIPLQNKQPTIIQQQMNNHFNNTMAAAAKISKMDELIPPCNVELCQDPFINSETIQLDIRGTHPTQGLMLQDSTDWNNRVFITGCHVGTAPRRVHKWTKRIKHSFLLKVNNIPITSTTQANLLINKAITNKEPTFSITVSHEDKIAMHHEEGIPMLYFDQLNMISSHLNSIKNNTNTPNNIHTTNPTK